MSLCFPHVNKQRVFCVNRTRRNVHGLNVIATSEPTLTAATPRQTHNHLKYRSGCMLRSQQITRLYTLHHPECTPENIETLKTGITSNNNNKKLQHTFCSTKDFSLVSCAHVKPSPAPPRPTQAAHGLSEAPLPPVSWLVVAPEKKGGSAGDSHLTISI